MSDAPDTVLHPSPDTTPEQARNARARAWAFIFDCHAKKKGAHPGALDDAKERFKNDSRAKSIIPK